MSIEYNCYHTILVYILQRPTNLSPKNLKPQIWVSVVTRATNCSVLYSEPLSGIIAQIANFPKNSMFQGIADMRWCTLKLHPFLVRGWWFSDISVNICTLNIDLQHWISSWFHPWHARQLESSPSIRKHQPDLGFEPLGLVISLV